MGIYIPGMEMPKKKNGTVIIVYPDGRAFTSDEKLQAVEVPPHGRLIDADALAKILGITDMDCNKCAWGNHGFCGRGGDFNDACEAIEDAPTIIPASKEETK